MTRIELMTQREALRKRLDELDVIKTVCMQCEHLGTDRQCAVFAQQVPKEQLSTDFGCESWSHDSIPF